MTMNDEKTKRKAIEAAADIYGYYLYLIYWLLAYYYYSI